MAIKFNVKADLDKLSKMVQGLAKDQLPYVTAKTLTELAKQVKEAHMKELKKDFTLRNKFVEKSFRVKYAKKADWPNCASEEGSTQEFMALQSKGGIKSAKSNTPLGVPLARGQRLAARPKEIDMIEHPMWVRNLLKQMGYVQAKSKTSDVTLLVKDKTPGFRRINIHAIKHQIRQRRHYRKHKPREIFFVLKSGVKIPIKFPFNRVAEQTVKKNSYQTFCDEFTKAMATRRKL
jgi:hypothetical protein